MSAYAATTMPPMPLLTYWQVEDGVWKIADGYGNIWTVGWCPKAFVESENRLRMELDLMKMKLRELAQYIDLQLPEH